MALRVCLDCGLEAYIEEDLDLFSKHKTGKYERVNLCKKCKNNRQRKYRDSNLEKTREKEREKAKKYRDSNHEKIKERMRNYRKANPIKTILARVKARSKIKEIDFDIDKEYLRQLWDECGGICQVTGINMKLSSYYNDPNTMSLDRINPDKGYIKDNIRLVSVWYNLARGNWGDELTLEMCQRVVERA